MARPPSTQPTDGELEILKILWESGPVGLGQIHGVLASGRPVAITTVATMLKMMLAKELVERQTGPRGFLWSARVSRQAAVSGLLGKLVKHVFDGSARRLVAHLIEDGGLDDRERAEILELLKSRATRSDKPASRKKGANE
jgi:predicted transcriptional regulator